MSSAPRMVARRTGSTRDQCQDLETSNDQCHLIGKLCQLCNLRSGVFILFLDQNEEDTINDQHQCNNYIIVKILVKDIIK